MAGVSSRTRSRNATTHCSLEGLYLLKRLHRKRASMESAIGDDAEVILIDDDDDDSSGEERLEHRVKKGTDKGENFGTLQNPIINVESSSSDSDETNDDSDFEGRNEENMSSSKGDQSSLSEYRKPFRTYSTEVDEMVRKAKNECSGNHSELENSPSSVNNVDSNVHLKHADDASASVSSNTFENKGSFEMKGCSSKMYDSAENQKEKGGKKQVLNVIDDDDEVIGESGQCCDETQKDFKRKMHSFGDQQSVPVLGDERSKRNYADVKDGDSMSVVSHERNVHSSRGVLMDETEGYGRLQRSMPCRPEIRLLQMLAKCHLENKNSMEAYSIQIEENHDEAVHQVDTRQKDCGENLLWSFADKAEPLQRSKSEEELDKLWEEMDICRRLEEVDSKIGNIGTPSPNSDCKHDLYLDEQIGLYCKLCGEVVTEIKYMCPPVVDRFPYKGSGKRLPLGGENVSLFDESRFNASGGNSSDAVFSNNKGTVWGLIPDIKQSLYPHQQEGFEFIWKNLAGNIDLQKLKSGDPCREGGCIISHAPGTGKTRLTIVFLQAYLKVFPKCLPVIVAPASLLLTWEDEFKKWDIGVPFHNLNNPELSGKEHEDCISDVDKGVDKVAKRMMKLCSWLKEKSILGISYNLYEKLAGEVEARKHKRNSRGEKKQTSVKKNTEYGMMGQVLRENPGLLVLDEGHTPRNEKSQIWKVLSKVQTKKRIILSGTPFQNNFLELYSTLRLVKPSFPEMIPPKLKKFCQTHQKKKKASEEWSWEPVSAGNTTGNSTDDKINQLKFLMDPLVHVYKGSILKKNLPGLRSSVLSLKPNSLQEEILQSIEGSPNGLDSEHKLALVSVHPSLFLCCTHQTRKEESAVESHREQLEKLRLDPYGGIKTRFLIEFFQLCDAMNEKVLVFSQFIDPLSLIIDQLKSRFNWSEGKEVLHINGKLSAKQKQFLIHTFNNEKSEAKIMLASTKACSEGINLVGASRVVLLDVVWNPSVERQAISRAYRLGQKRVVYTYHLITPIEVTKLCQQAEKDRLSELVFSSRDVEGGESKRRALDLEDRVLDKMFKHAELKHIFAQCVVQPNERDLFESPSS